MLQGELLIHELLGIPLGQVDALDEDEFCMRWAQARWIEQRRMERTKWALLDAIGTLLGK